MALISNRTSRRLDRDVIWRTQQLPEERRIEIPAPARLLRSFFDRAPGNISEWAKKPARWEVFQGRDFTGPISTGSAAMETAEGQRNSGKGAPPAG